MERFRRVLFVGAGRLKPALAALVALAGVAVVISACSNVTITAPPRTTTAPPATDATTCVPGVDLLGFSDALDKVLFENTNVSGLSALAYDVREDVYYSLVDSARGTPARFYTLRLPLDRSELGDPSILGVTILRDSSGQPFTGSNFDGEGLAPTSQGEILISSETEPSIRRFALDGTLLGELPVPQRFLVAPQGEALSNTTFESLSVSPNERSLFTANEAPLASDGRTAAGQNRVRILRYENRGPEGFEPAEQFFYLTEPEQGVVEISALGERELLVLERGFIPGEGNTVRVFRVSLAGAEDVSGEESLAAPGLVPVEKELLVDLADLGRLPDCPPSGATNTGAQENPLLDNFEGLTPGPRLPGGEQALLLISDDNFSGAQVTRVIALGVRL